MQFCSELAVGGEQRYSRDIQNTSLDNLFAVPLKLTWLKWAGCPWEAWNQRPGSEYLRCCMAKVVTGR